MAHFMISAAHKSSGKTTLSIGLCAALAARGLRVQPFKKGPDYIDPLWLSEAAGRGCHNLDFYTQSHAEIRRVVGQHAASADVCVYEGNKGLFDGMDVEGSNSNAALAHLLGAPVVLVLNTQGMTRGVAPLLLGYQAFDPALNIAGVILNQVGGQRHEGKLRAVLERYTEVPVLGAVQRDAALAIDERHLGLMPSNEKQGAREKIDLIAERVAAQVDLDALLALARHSAPPAASAPISAVRRTADVRVGVFRDAAFGFYYPGDLDALQTAGAELVFIDALCDQRLPAVDGLFIGGGFPETQLDGLAANQTLKQAVRAAVEANLPVYAECGGLMYLSRRITWGDSSGEMVGALPVDTRMYAKPQGRGYVRLQETGKGPWPLRDDKGGLASFAAHEFHYSKLENVPVDLNFAYQVLRGTGIDGERDGIVYKNTLACYAHLRHVDANPWAQRFVEFIRGQCESSVP